MGNIPRRHSFGDQPMDRIFGDTARMEQADYQARRRAALHLCTPSGLPRLRRAWFEIGHDIDHDRLARPQRFGESGGDFARMLDPDSPDPKAPGDGGEVGRPEADQLLSPTRSVARGATHPGQVLAKARIVIDNDRNGNAAAPGRLELGKVIIEPAIAGEAQYLAR